MFGLIMFLIGLSALLTGVMVFWRGVKPSAKTARESSGRSWGSRVFHFGVGGVTAMLGLILTFLTVTTVVDARSIGVQTAFGRYVKTLDNGFYFIAPWSEVEQFPTTVQTVDIEGDGNVLVTYSSMEGESSQANVGGGKGTFDGNYAWSLSPDGKGAEELWGRYRNFDRVSKELVAPAIRDTIVAVGSTYSAVNAPVSQPQISSKVKAALQEKLSAYGVIIDRVSITGIANDKSTQERIDRIIAAQSDIRRAREEKTRAEIDAQTTKIREKSGSLSPAANQRYCLEIVNSWNAQANGPLPATFNCTLNGASSTPIIVDGTNPSTSPTETSSKK